MDYKIQRKTLREEVVYLLREKILSGQIVPGQRIIEAELSSKDEWEICLLN